MIAEQTALHSPKQTLVTAAWRALAGRPYFTGIRAGARRFTRSLTRWARVPVLPYAALWEASLVVNSLSQLESLGSDRATANTFVLTNAWLRG